MQDNFVVAGKGLQIMFWGIIVSLVGSLIPLIGGIVGIAGELVLLYGLYTAMSAHENYKMAMYMTILGVVLTILRTIFSGGLFHALLTIAVLVVSFLEVYYICSASAELLTAKGDLVQADRAQLIITLNLICTVVLVACTLVVWIPLVNILAAVAAIVAAIVAVVAFVLQIIFYYKASQSLLA